MKSERWPGRWWVWALLLVLLVVGAFAVPIGGALRDSSARTVIAAGIIVVGAGIALLLVELTGREQS